MTDLNKIEGESAINEIKHTPPTARLCRNNNNNETSNEFIVDVDEWNAHVDKINCAILEINRINKEHSSFLKNSLFDKLVYK